MSRKYIGMFLAVIMTFWLAAPAFAEGEPEAPPPAEIVDEAPPALDEAAPTEGVTAEDAIVEEVVTEDAPAEEESTDYGIMTISATPISLPTGGVTVNISGPIGQLNSLRFYAPGGGEYDNPYTYEPSMGLCWWDDPDQDGLGDYRKQADSLPTQFSVYPGTEMIILMQPEYDITISAGSVARNTFYLDHSSEELNIDERLVNVIAPESGSMTITIAPTDKAMPRSVPMTMYGGPLQGDGFESANVGDETSFGQWSYFEADEQGVEHGTIFTSTKLCFQLKSGYTIQVIKGGRVIRVGGYFYPTTSDDCVGVDIQVDDDAQEFVFAIVRQGERFDPANYSAIVNEPVRTDSGSAADTATQTGGTFADVASGAWYESPVMSAYEKGIVKGVTENTFSPNSTTTRGQTVTMLYRAMGSPGGANVFSDTSGEVGSAAGWASASGVTCGVSTTAFAPNSSITREQLVTMLYRMAGSPAADTSKLASFTDGGSVQSYAQSAVAWAITGGLLTGYGDGTIRPAGVATRAEVCTIIMRYLG